MHRRTLIIRRFGALDFGLGYFRNGTWVDHADANGALDEAEPDGSRSMDAVHEWLACCGRPADGLRAVNDRVVTVAQEPGLHVAAR